MSNKNKTVRTGLKGTRVTAHEIRHFVDGIEVASLPEACMRLGLPSTRKNADDSYANPTLNGIHGRREELLPTPYLYGSAYYYPLETLNEVINNYKVNAEVKVARNDKLGKLLAKLKENPELLEMLSSLVE
jgi:hypothetical protein